MVGLEDDPIELVASRYDARRGAYLAERDRVRIALEKRDLLDSLVRVEHVGSTAVPDLAAKDIVDLDVVVDDDVVPAVSRAIAADLPGRRCENSEEWHPVARRHDDQRFNDHVFAEWSDGWKTSVATREVLRTRPALRERYEQQKRGLAGRYDDLVAYSEGKSDIVDVLLEAARGADDPDLAFDFEIPSPSRES